MMPMVDERNHIYGPWKVTNRTNPNCKGNKWVRWECQCVYCGKIYIVAGARLRQKAYRKKCPHCGLGGKS